VLDSHPNWSAVAEFSRFHNRRQAVLRGPSEEEIIVILAADLLEAGLTKGDLVLFDPESRIAWEKVQNRHRQSGLLEVLPLDVRIEDLGGLDDIFRELAEEVSLHLLHPERAVRYQLKPAIGVIFCGLPGTGKSSLVRALGRHLQNAEGVEIRAFQVPPGSHRSQ
jgi:ATP-dependent 26S proteasome regulatory subunit